MTTEDKAKAYDEALEKAKKRIKSRFNALALDDEDLTALRVLGLVDAESEDERIRKQIEQAIIEHDWSATYKVSKDDCLAYLEKQKEQKPELPLMNGDADLYFDEWRQQYQGSPTKRECFEEGIEYAQRLQKEQKPSTPEDIAAAYQMGLADGRREQKPAEKQDYSGLNDLERAILRGFLCAGVENVPVSIIKETAQECIGLLKPAEWSEKDRNMLYSILLYFNAPFHDMDDIEKNMFIWLQSLPERFNLESKQEWSEEDKNIMHGIEQCVYNNVANIGTVTKIRYIDFLKSLRPQPKNPVLSEKMVICLKRTLDFLRKEHNAYTGEDFTNEIPVLEWLITHPTMVLSYEPHWKPSEEQMTAFHVLLGAAPRAPELYELYNALEKL